MTLANTVRQRIAELAPTNDRQELAFTAEGSPWSATVTLDGHDKIGSLLWEVSLRRSAAAAGDLRTWAERIVRKVTGLLEPLKLVEIDTLRQEGQLRSEHPTVQGDKVLYYEIFLKGTSAASVRRFEAGHDGARRQQVVFALTHEALAKLVRDITAEK